MNMEEQKSIDKSSSSIDEELSELLDSALEDFKECDDGKLKESQVDPTNNKVEAEWSDEFVRQAAEQFESNISSILRGVGNVDLTSDQIQQSFQRMAEAASQVGPAGTGNIEPDNDADFAASISQALRGLSEGTENLQNPFSEQDLMNMFGQQTGDANTFVPFMQGMMQSLLSRDVLYPSLKDILDKYPTWLEANGGSLSLEDRDKYEKQQQLMKQVCEQLEKESESDTPEQKKAQFDKVLSLMQKLQDYGQPPSDLVGELGPGVPFDSQGNPDMNQCSVM